MIQDGGASSPNENTRNVRRICISEIAWISCN